MIIEALNEYLDTLAGYVYDSDKVVTYKWLSKELEVHVNVAKQILYEFWLKHQNDNDVQATFLLMGTLHDGSMRVEVVKECNLSEAKKKFSKLISEHLYSLQKALPDIELLAISGEGDIRYSAIRCNESTERNDLEMHVLRWGAGVEQFKETEKAKPEPESNNAQTSPEPSHSKADKKTAGTKKNAVSQKTGFNNLFGKAVNKQKSPSNASEVSNKETQKKETSPKENKSGAKKKGGLDSFFAKSNNQKKTSPPPPVKNNKVASDDEKEKEQSKEQSEEPPEEQSKEQAKEQSKEQVKEQSKEQIKEQVSKSNNKVNKKPARGKKRNRSKESENTTKKRKRITVLEDSSDSESHSEEEPMDIPSSPEPPPVKQRSPSPPRVKHEGGKRKVLKLVDKTFEEDGFLVTKKVHVYESCSEDEPDNAENKEPAKQEPKPEPKAKKQTALTDFFRKS